MAKIFDINKFNKILYEYNQNLRAVSVAVKEIVLSNGLILTDKNEIVRCKKRVMSGNEIWKLKFDSLYSINETERLNAEDYCRSVTSIQGGMSCQEKHGFKIKNNLNSGTPWNKGMSGTYPYSYSCLPSTREKISLANKGERNGMFGTKMSQEEKNYRSKLMRERILNGNFTPNSNNRNTHWESHFNNKKYRSSWEALYQYFDPDAEYESLRIPYTFNKKEYIYIIDFVNHSTKTVIEVKPKELLSSEKTLTKIDYAKRWCEINGYSFSIVDKEYLISKSMPDNLDSFDEKTRCKIRKLYETY